MDLEKNFKDFSDSSRDKFAEIVLFIKNIFISEIPDANIEEKNIAGGVKIIFHKRNFILDMQLNFLYLFI